jgi:ABC-type Zn uptake system ZnuABC Zn-binding protein ZnuA
LFRKSLLLIALVLSATALTTHAQPERLRVIASFSILADVAHNVAGDAADVESLMPLGADPHSFTPAPSNIAAIADADLVLISGIGFEEALLETLQSAAQNVNLVTVSECVNVLPFGESDAHTDEHEDEHAHDEHEDDAHHCDSHVAELGEQPSGQVAPLGRLYELACGSDEHAHDEHEDDAEHVHEAGSCDPHVWFDPYNVQLWTLAIRDTLSELDPANAETYAANAAAYIAELETLRGEIEAQVGTLAPEQRVLVTNHGSLGYLANAYGFRIVGLVVPSSSSDAQPSAAQIAALIDAIRQQNVPAVFAETTVNPSLAEQIANDAGAQFYTLYTESLSEENGPAPTYLDFMRYNIQTIVSALSRNP